MARRLATAHPDVDTQAAVVAWSASPGRVEPAVLALVRAVRASVPVVLLTNATSRLPADLDALGLTAEFDAVASSSALGHAKPSAPAYRAAHAVAASLAGDPSLEPAEVLFVDDSARNVAGASAFGWHAVRFLDAPALARTLAGVGLLPARSRPQPDRGSV